jgi:hypothetical protein
MRKSPPRVQSNQLITVIELGDTQDEIFVGKHPE